MNNIFKNTIYPPSGNEMMLFLTDILLGVLLVGGLVLIGFGVRTRIYRGGIGPILLAISGALLLASVILAFGVRTYDWPIDMIIPDGIFMTSLLALSGAFYFWRK